MERVCRVYDYGDTKNDTSYIMCDTSFNKACPDPCTHKFPWDTGKMGVLISSRDHNFDKIRVLSLWIDLQFSSDFVQTQNIYKIALACTWPTSTGVSIRGLNFGKMCVSRLWIDLPLQFTLYIQFRSNSEYMSALACTWCLTHPDSSVDQGSSRG